MQLKLRDWAWRLSTVCGRQWSPFSYVEMMAKPLHAMNAAYALYLVIRCQWLPGVLLSRHLDRGLIQRFNFQRDCAIHKTATIWGLMLKHFLSFKSIFARQRMMLKSKLRWMLKSKQRIMLKSKLRRKLISITYICQSIMLMIHICIIRLDLLRAFSHKSTC